MSWLWKSKDSQGSAPAGSQNSDEKPVAEQPNSDLNVIPRHFDAANLHPMAKLGEIEFLDLDTNARKADGLIASRGWTEDLSYGTGAMYLLGLSTGGLYGFAEAMRSTSEKTPTKIRINTILNSITRRGPYIGNTCGVVTIFYNFIGGAIDYMRDGKRDDAGCIAAGGLTGALYRIGSGPKAIAISSAVGLGAASAWCVVKRLAAPVEDDDE